MTAAVTGLVLAVLQPVLADAPDCSRYPRASECLHPGYGLGVALAVDLAAVAVVIGGIILLVFLVRRRRRHRRAPGL